MNPFTLQIEALRADSRFRNLTSPDSKELCLLSLWVLDLELPTGRETRLIYGWVVASPMSESTPWVGTASSWKTFDPDEPEIGKYRMGRIGLNALPRLINEILKNLGEGMTLRQISECTGIEPPERFAQLRIAKNAEGVAQLYVPGRFRFLSTSTSQEIMPRGSRPMRSPSAESPAFSAAVARLNKTSLWMKDTPEAPPPVAASTEREPLPNADELAKKSLEYLSSETGLKFSEADARRTGDVEWLSLPTTDPQENECVHLKTTSQRDTDGNVIVNAVTVQVVSGQLVEGTKILVRCRLYCGREVFSDECRFLKVGEPASTFPATSELTRIVANVWTYYDEHKGGRLWYERDVYIIRQISIGMGVSGLRGRLQSDWTSSLASVREKVRKRVEKVSAIDQVSYQRSHVGQRSSQETAEYEIDALAIKLFPEESEGKFFARGWDKEEGPGFLGLVEWFQKLTDNSVAKTIVIVDPYFGDVGIKELLGRVKATQTEYVVVTSTQIASRDDESPDEARQPVTPRSDLIRKQCEAMAPILDQLQIRIVDVRNKGTNRDPIFHDRYVLVYGEVGKPSKGYHLSNSIQQATKNYPLLVTPIPGDLLDAVGAYVDSLLVAAPEVVGSAEVVTLFSTVERRRPLSTLRVDPLATPGAPQFFALLLKDASLQTKDAEQLGAFLRDVHHMSDDGSFLWTKEVQDGLSGTVDELASVAGDSFNKLWAAFSVWKANLRWGGSTLLVEFSRVAAKLGPSLEEFLVNTPTQPSPFGTKDLPANAASLGIGHLFFSPFEKALWQINQVVGLARTDYRLGNYPVRIACETLAYISVERLVRVVERVAEALPENERTISNSPRQVAALYVLIPALGALIERLSGKHNDVLTAMLASSLALIRAVATQFLIQHNNLQVVVDGLGSLSPYERVLALAEISGNLRVAANRNDYKETDEIRTARLQVFNKLIEQWPTHLEAAHLRTLILRIGGPGQWSWAFSTTKELLEPLVASSKMTWDEISNLWGGLLDENLRAMGTNETNSHAYYHQDDSELSRAFAYSLVNASEEMRRQWLKSLTECGVRASRYLGSPFARSRDYPRWAGAIDQQQWLWVTIGCVLSSGKGRFSREEVACWRAAMQGLHLMPEPGHRIFSAELWEFRMKIATEIGEALEK